jgi:hypothetical protein
VNFTPSFTTNIIEINKTDNLVYIPISLILVAGIAYICWKNRASKKKTPPVTEATPVVEAANSFKHPKGKIQIRMPIKAV